MRWAETHVSLAHAHLLNPWNALAAACPRGRTGVESLQRPLRAEPNTVAAGGELCLGFREKSGGLETA